MSLLRGYPILGKKKLAKGENLGKRTQNRSHNYLIISVKLRI